MKKKFNGAKDGNGFENNPQNINRNGRPPKLVSHINKELLGSGFEPCKVNDIKDAYLTLLNLPLSTIAEIASKETNTDYPMLYKLVAKELTGKRGMDMLEKLLDRAIGKAQQYVDHTTKGEKIITPITVGTMTNEELLDYLDKQNEQSNNQ